MIKTVIFDMDGVLIDSEIIFFQINRMLFKKLNIEVSDNLLDSFVGASGNYKWETIKKLYKLPQSCEELTAYNWSIYVKYLQDNIHDLKPIDGVVNFIEDLHKNKIKLAVASSSPMRVIEIVMNAFNINKYFDILVEGGQVSKGKPEPDIFLYAADKIGSNIKDCLVIEDSSNGVRAAKRAGMKCIGFYNRNSGEQDLSEADIIISSFKDINFHEIVQLGSNRNKYEI